MPIIKAAIKYLRQSERHRKRNRALKTRMKEGIKEIVKMAQAKKFDEVARQLPAITSLIDKAAKKNILHDNNAARKKSRLARLLASAK